MKRRTNSSLDPFKQFCLTVKELFSRSKTKHKRVGEMQNQPEFQCEVTNYCYNILIIFYMFDLIADQNKQTLK